MYCLKIKLINWQRTELLEAAFVFSLVSHESTSSGDSIFSKMNCSSMATRPLEWAKAV